jgi:hypothetical protein
MICEFELGMAYRRGISNHFINRSSHFDDKAMTLQGLFIVAFDLHQVRLEQRQLQAGTACTGKALTTTA